MSRPSSKPNDAGAESERGFILVAVLWILSALAVLSAVYSLYVSNAAVAAHVTDDGVNAEAAVRAGVELAAYELTAAPESSGSAQLTAAPGSSRPAQGGFAFRLGRSRIKVSFIAEGARIDLNAAPKRLLVGLFEAIGAKPDDADTFADRVVGWRKKADGEGQDAEADIYKSEGYSYAPREAPFQNTLELSLYDPGATPSVASIAFATTGGDVDPPAYQGLPISAGSMLTLDVGRYLPSEALLGVTVTSTGGPVVVGALEAAPTKKAVMFEA